MEIFIGIIIVIIIASVLMNNAQTEDFTNRTKPHLDALLRKKHQLLVYDDYGNQNAKKYFKEIDYFISSTLQYNKHPRSKEHLVLHNLITNMVDKYDQEQSNKNNQDNSYMHFDANMSPNDYEYFCRDLLTNSGWDARVTQQSGDQGVDVMVYDSNANALMAIQCKLYSKPVGNKAVQEVFAAKTYSGAINAAVVTNNTYTRPANELANKTGVLLLHHDDLRDFQSLFKS